MVPSDMKKQTLTPLKSLNFVHYTGIRLTKVN